MEAAVHTCKNCGQVFEKNFCNACGQKTAHRLDVKHVLHEAFHVFTHADKGILSFIPKILLQPGFVALNYVEGKRKRYFSPFQYLVIVVGLVTFLVAKTNYMESVYRSFDTAGQSAALAASAQKVNGFMQRYYNLMAFAFIPGFTFFTWLFFRKRKYNYAEVFVLQTCIQGQSNTIALFFMPLVIFLPATTHQAINLFSILLMFLGMALANRQFFKITWVRSILLTLLIYVLCTTAMGLVSGLAALVLEYIVKQG